MSAFGYKRKFWGPLVFFCFTPESGRSCRQPSESACDPKRTFKVIAELDTAGRWPKGKVGRNGVTARQAWGVWLTMPSPCHNALTFDGTGLLAGCARDAQALRP